MTTFAEAFGELMNKFDENRARWIDEKGSDKGFNEWFTSQVEEVAQMAAPGRWAEALRGSEMGYVTGTYHPMEGERYHEPMEWFMRIAASAVCLRGVA